MRDQLDRSHLIETHNHAVLGAVAVQAKDPFGLGLEVRVRAPLPRAGALVGEPRHDQRLTHRLRADVDPHPGEMLRELRQRPARQRHTLGVRAGARDRHDPVALLGRGFPGTPAPIVRVQRREPSLIEPMDHLAHMRLIGAHRSRDLWRRHPNRRGQQDRRALALGLVLRAFGDLLQPRTFLRRELAHEHLRRTHDHLQARGHSSPFATGGHFRSNVSRRPTSRTSLAVCRSSCGCREIVRYGDMGLGSTGSRRRILRLSGRG